VTVDLPPRPSRLHAEAARRGVSIDLVIAELADHLPESNTFCAYNLSGTRRTFYKPDPASRGYATNWDGGTAGVLAVGVE